MTSFIETLNHWGGQFLNLAWPVLWQSSLLITIVFVLDFALRRKIRAAIRYALWLVVLVKLLLPPSLALPTGLAWWLLPSPQSPAKPPTTAFVVTYGDQAAPIIPLQSQPAPAPVQPKMSSAAWALAASGVVSAGLLAWLLVRWRQIYQKVRRAKTSEELIPVLDEARRLTRLRPGIRLKLTEDSMSPAVCGLFRPVILLPQSLVEKLSAGQLRAVLLHEAIHLRRGDVWVNCAQALLQIFYWWHPLLWLANARIRRVREEAVDDAVMLALRADAEIYAPTLLEVAKLAFNRPLASLGLVGILESRSALRQRIERLINFNAPRKAGLTLVSILGILAFTAVALPMGEAPEQTNAPTVSSRSGLPVSTNAPEDVFKTNASMDSVTGILSDTNFQAAIHALQQRTQVETLAEPKPDITSGRQADSVNANRIQQAEYTPVAGGDTSSSTNAFDKKVEAGNLVQDGKLLYEIGRFEEAETKLKAALALTPDNQAAHYYMNLVQAAKSGWHTNNIHSSPGREAIFSKLNSLRLESISWSNGIPLSEAIRYLAEQSKLRDPDKNGINFVFNPNVAATTTATNAAPESVDPSTINVKLVMNNISLHDVLDAVVLVADRQIKYSVEDYAIVISPKPPPGLLEMRVFKIDTNTFTAGYLMRHITGNPDLLSGLETNSVPTMAKSFFSAIGVNLNAPGRSIAYGDRLGLLFVKATPSELDAVEHAIQALNMIPPQIHIKARFIEVPKKGFAMPQLFTNAVAGPMTGILSDPEFRTALHALEHQKGVETLAEPEAVTTSGRQTQMRATTIEEVITNLVLQKNPTNATIIVPQIGMIEIGPTVDIVPYVLSDGYTINLTAMTHTVEFLGYEKANNAVYTTNSAGKRIKLPTAQPGLRVQQAKAIVNLWDNQTLVLGNLKSDFVGGDGQIQNESKFFQDAEKKNGTADKELLVFITATIVDPAGNRVHTDTESPFNPSTIPPQPKIPTPSP
jgi:beta-lactamase regulating signal transducer with metallopeptidase domain/Flp pilus assembly secretin CpaC